MNLKLIREKTIKNTVIKNDHCQPICGKDADALFRCIFMFTLKSDLMEGVDGILLMSDFPFIAMFGSLFIYSAY